MFEPEMVIMYEWIRAFHIIFVIFWMAGMLYLPRLYVYHSRAKLGGEADEMLKIQEQKLLRIIINPAMLAVFGLGFWMLYLRWDAYKLEAWLHAKLLLVFLMGAYHGFLSKKRKQFAAGERPHSEKFFRVINEIPPILTIFIVILVVIKPF
ncbi:MAG: protoporphyrinogen oxidase HemJ [Hellea sp.]|nr:protoporphyrinogen oxidase HemJ [Hellea sp.]